MTFQSSYAANLATFKLRTVPETTAEVAITYFGGGGGVGRVGGDDGTLKERRMEYLMFANFVVATKR